MSSPRPLTFYSSREDRPGSAWRALYDATAAGYRAWYAADDGRPRPSLREAAARLERHLPELVPIWQQLRELSGDDPEIARLLTLWNPPRFLPGCSQAVVAGTEPVLIRNYDYDPDLCERLVTSTRWGDRRVLGTSDCLWGLVDGMNDDGLAVSLTYAGRAGAGDGFGVPLVLRYLLETCTTRAEVRRTLARVPVHMAYNLTVVDADADVATFFVAPGQVPEESTVPIATNHRGREPEDVVHARRFRSVERQRRLEHLLATTAPDPAALERHFLTDPLYSTRWDEAFGTVYTATYRPTTGRLDLTWPGSRWQLDFDSPAATHTVTLGESPAGTPLTPMSPGPDTDAMATESLPDQPPSPPSSPSESPATGPAASRATELAGRARAAIAALAELDDPAAFHELLALSGEVGVALGHSARNLAHAQSWAGVGQHAGLSRQTAWARWGPTDTAS